MDCKLGAQGFSGRCPPAPQGSTSRAGVKKGPRRRKQCVGSEEVTVVAATLYLRCLGARSPIRAWEPNLKPRAGFALGYPGSPRPPRLGPGRAPPASHTSFWGRGVVSQTQGRARAPGPRESALAQRIPGGRSVNGNSPPPPPSRMLQPGGISSRDWRALVARTRVPAHAHTARTSAPPPRARVHAGPDASPRTPVGSRVHSGH